MSELKNLVPFTVALKRALEEAEQRYGKDDTLKQLELLLGKEVKAFYAGNVVKYLSRYLRSTNSERDLIKAVTYLYFIWRNNESRSKRLQ